MTDTPSGALPPPPPSTAPIPPDGGRRRSRAQTTGVIAVVVALVLGGLIAVTLLVRGGGGDDASDPTASPMLTTVPAADLPSVDGFAFGTAPCAPADVAEPVRVFDGAPRQCIDPTHTYSAVVTTNHGSFTIELDVAHSPGTVNNFVTLARSRYYDGTGCHRVIAGFVVQCGRPGDDERAPGYTIPDELPQLGDYELGVVAMANTGLPDSGGGQWFIITGTDGASLPPQYSIVGRVVDGYDTTVTALAGLADPNAANGVPPLDPIDIESIEIVEG